MTQFLSAAVLIVLVGACHNAASTYRSMPAQYINTQTERVL